MTELTSAVFGVMYELLDGCSKNELNSAIFRVMCKLLDGCPTFDFGFSPVLIKFACLYIYIHMFILMRR